MSTREVLQLLAASRTGRLSRSNPTLSPVRRSTWKCLLRRGSVVADAQSSYVVITAAGRKRVGK